MDAQQPDRQVRVGNFSSVGNNNFKLGDKLG
jgi:hypothetical protein